MELVVGPYICMWVCKSRLTIFNSIHFSFHNFHLSVRTNVAHVNAILKQALFENMFKGYIKCIALIFVWNILNLLRQWHGVLGSRDRDGGDQQGQRIHRPQLRGSLKPLRQPDQQVGQFIPEVY